MSQIIALTIPVLTPSLNVTANQHWATRGKQRDEYIWQLKVAIAKQEGWEAKVGEKREIEVVSYRTRLLDHDNFMGGLKGLVDAMRNVRLIYQDDGAHLVWRNAIQVKVPHLVDCRTEIALYR